MTNALTTLRAALSLLDRASEAGYSIECDDTAEDLRRVIASMEAHPEPVGISSAMPGTDGFTMAAFESAKVPVGTKLYAQPSEPKAEPARLTDAEILEVAEPFGELQHGDAQGHKRISFGRAIEQALRSKNNG